MSEERNNAMSFIADFDGDEETLFNIELPSVASVLPMRNMVTFPGIIVPVAVSRKRSLKLIQRAAATGEMIAVVCQKRAETERPTEEDIFTTGVASKVVRILDLPDGPTTAILQGFARIHLDSVTEMKDGELKAVISEMPEDLNHGNETEFGVTVDAMRDMAIEWIKLSSHMNHEGMFAMKNIQNAMFLTNFLCTHMPLPLTEKMHLLEARSLKKRIMKLMSLMNREVQLARLKENIQQKTHEDIDQQQREYFLQQQIRNIQNELGGSPQEQDVKDLNEKAAKKVWSHKEQELFERELRKLERLSTQSPDYNVQLNYLQTMLQLPWNYCTTDNLNLKNAQKVLDKDHYGLEKVKERILEHLAVLQLKGTMKAPIICLYGPPGVGKTSLGRSIAAALKRNYVRISLGGLHDEAEIRGHRKTYIGAMPGRIIKGLIKAGSSNPVFILDEIDKVTSLSGHNGDPSSALLEVLDPEQNNTFHDNYLDTDYDLSKVMFIATANSLNTIPGPLLDRMELIEVSGYITEEKIEIAKRHLIPRETEENGLKALKPKLSKAAIERLIEGYTRESGVRHLDKKISEIMRKIALGVAKDEMHLDKALTPDDIERLIGKPDFSRDKYQGNRFAGVVTGLAWTSVGGEILFIETSLSKGKGSKLTLTGNLGDVMKESAVLALEYIKAHAERLNIDSRIFNEWNIHIHVPEGAVPKDGPSAGITIATSLASALTQRKVRANIAMTGEITLRGKVLPVGGIKEKILAARRAGIKDIMICHENRKHIEEIPQMYVEGLTFHYVEEVSEVLDFALLKEKVSDAVDLMAPVLEEEKRVQSTEKI